MKLPNADRAIVEISKLRDYCLNPDHPRGRHKARVFVSALNLTAENAEELQKALLSAAKTNDALLTAEDEYGTRYQVDFNMSHQEK